MDSNQVQFIGAPCGSHGPYTFYKAIKFLYDGKTNILSLGEFFFLKILDEFPVCIGEIQLLWEEKGTNQLLASVRLYFQPRETPGGPIDCTAFGDDELLVMGEKLILTVEDLVARIKPPNSPWNFGRPFQCFYDLPKDDEVITDGSAELCGAFANSNLSCVNFDDVEKEKSECGSDCSSLVAPVVIMTYPAYCRYRAVLKRIETLTDAWLKNTLVMAIGGLTSLQRGNRIMFCREAFEYRDLEDLDFHLDHLAPNLKGRPRKRKLKKDDSDSNDYGSDQSSNASSTAQAQKIKSQRLQNRLESREGKGESRSDGRNGITPVAKRRVSEEEKQFLKNLYKFMASRNSPIDRLPSLGFKQIDLYALYRAARRLGGYTKICNSRLWKVLYDQLGGHATNTSAATCTRKHYERLILPYENHLRKLHRARAKAIGGEDLPPPDVKDAGQNTQNMVNGQISTKTSSKPSEPDPESEETKSKPSNDNFNDAQDKPIKEETMDSDKKNGVKIEAASLDNHHQAKTSIFINTGMGTETTNISDAPHHLNTPATTSSAQPSASPQQGNNVPGHKVFKVEDMYEVEMKPAYVQRVAPLEVPVLRHRMATSIMSPIMQRKHHGALHPHQAESPQHFAALPGTASMIKHPSFLSGGAGGAATPASPTKNRDHHHHHQHRQHSSSSSKHHSHNQHHNQEPHHQGGGGSSRQHQHHPHQSQHFNHHPHHHHSSSSRNKTSSSSSPQKAPAAHSKTAHSLPHNVLPPMMIHGGERMLNYSLVEGFHPQRVTDPHVLASRPSSQVLPPPPPAHSNFVKAVMPPDRLPHHQLVIARQQYHQSLFQHQHHQQQRRHHHRDHEGAAKDVLFPHPDQVLSRIHTQQQGFPSAEAKARQKPLPSHAPLSAPSPAQAPGPSTSSFIGAKNSGMDLTSQFPLSLLPSSKDSSSSSSCRKSRPGSASLPGDSGPKQSGSSTGPSSSSTVSATSGALGVAGSSSHSEAQANAQRMAEALQLQAAQQPDVMLQSALFGAQFTALPRPAKPSEAALQAFVPYHPAFVQALMGQGFPPVSAASAPMGLYPPQLSPTAHAQLLAYGEEMMRQKAALSSMTANSSMAPFLMGSLPPGAATFNQPPSKESPQK